MEELDPDTERMRRGSVSGCVCVCVCVCVRVCIVFYMLRL